MSIAVTISPDGMEATVQIQRQSESPPDIDVIHRALAEAGVGYGIDDTACRELIESAKQIQIGERTALCAARGSLPVHGLDGRVEMVVVYDRNPVGMLRESGAIDFHERGSFTPIQKDQLIARIIPATPGVPGKTVRGEELVPRPGQPARIRSGPGTKLEAKGTELRAAKGGDLRCVGDLIEVLDVIRISGDLDYSAGSIECEGPVRVEGDVLPGFHIYAGGDVWIKGVVDSAVITTKGNVVIGQGVIRRSRISATQGISAGFVRDSYLESAGNIKILTEALNSTMVSGDTISIASTGRVVGGRLAARNVIETGKAGNEKGIKTFLAAGIDPYQELRAAKLSSEIHRAEKIEARVANIKQLAKPEQQEALDRIADRQAAARQRTAEELAELQQRALELAGSRIKVRTELHPGVTIRIGNAEMVIDEDQEGASFFYDSESGEVVEVDWKGDK